MDDVPLQVERRRRVADANEADPAPDAGTADRVVARLDAATRLERRVGALAVRQLHNGRGHVDLARVEHNVGAKPLRQLEPLRRDVDRDDPRAHRLAEQRAAQPDRPLPEYHQRVAP